MATPASTTALRDAAVLDPASRTWTLVVSGWDACRDALLRLHDRVAAAQEEGGEGPLPEAGDSVRFVVRPGGGGDAAGVDGGGSDEPLNIGGTSADAGSSSTSAPIVLGGGTFPLFDSADPACVLSSLLLAGATEPFVSGLRVGRTRPLVMLSLEYVRLELQQGMPLTSPEDVRAWAAQLRTDPPVLCDPALESLTARLLRCPGRNEADGVLYGWLSSVAALPPFAPRLSELRRPTWMAGLPRGAWAPAPAASGLPAGAFVAVLEVHPCSDAEDSAAAVALATAAPHVQGGGGEVLYHGTSWDGAAGLMTRGIPHTSQLAAADFGEGFYLPPHFLAARDRAGMAGAVLVFSRARALERVLRTDGPHGAPLPHLELRDCDAPTEWRAMVGAVHLRQEGVVAAIAEASDVLTGPIPANPSAVASNTAPPKPLEGSEQVVLKTQHACSEYTHRVVGVLYLVAPRGVAMTV